MNSIATQPLKQVMFQMMYDNDHSNRTFMKSNDIKIDQQIGHRTSRGALIQQIQADILTDSQAISDREVCEPPKLTKEIKKLLEEQSGPFMRVTTDVKSQMRKPYNPDSVIIDGKEVELPERVKSMINETI